ncbi:Rhomboid-like protein 11, chloroplastic [Orobanche hederae]
MIQLQLQQKQFVPLLKFHGAHSFKLVSVATAPPPHPPSKLNRVSLLSLKRNHRLLLCRMNWNSALELGKTGGKRKPEKRVNGIFWIVLINLGIYLADHVFQCSRKLVEEEEGNFALWLSFILTGAGANLVSWLVLPQNVVSIGASGAVFGLFAVSVLVKMSWDWRKILEVLILGQFVVEKVMEAAQASARLGGSLRGGFGLQNVNHIAHLSGALVGVLLIWLLSSVPSPTDDK